MKLSIPYLLKKVTTPGFRKFIREKIFPIPKSFLSLFSSTEKERIEKEIIAKGVAKLIGRSGEITYSNDGFLTTHHVRFMHDERFKLSYKNAFISTPESLRKVANIEWRAHICCWAASRAIHLDGDFVELGVWYGLLSKTMCEYVSFEKYTDKRFYLVDSFGEMTGSHLDKSYQEDIFDVVSNRFSKYPNVNLIRGLVPEVLPRIPVQKIAYLAIDMNGSEPERAALEYFYDKVVSGGVIYFDDYGWGYPELRKVVDNFFANKPEELLHFPSGNSIVVKI
jgi:hypothetical protein